MTCPPGEHEDPGWTGLRLETRGTTQVPVYTFHCTACGETWDEDYAAGSTQL